MISTKYYLDTRSKKKDGTHHLKLLLTHKRKVALLSTNIYLLPEQWDKASGRIVNHPQKNNLNVFLLQRKIHIDEKLFVLTQTKNSATLSMTYIKNYIESPDDQQQDSSFFSHFQKFASLKKGSTAELYNLTMRHMQKFDPKIKSRLFEDINKEWLTRFDNHLSITSPSRNARNIHLRNIRAVFNDAIDMGITTCYPFRRLKIRPAPTRKRSLTVEQLRTLINYPVEPHVEKYRDLFLLMFMLIGINMKDIFLMPNRIINGRLEYYRHKTGKLYSVKVEPEALEIIYKYRGRKHLLNFADTCDSHENFRRRTNEMLKRIGAVQRMGLGGRKIFDPILPNISTYWCRHTWASIAAELDIPKETIAAALGHSGNTVTDIYINFDQRKVDVANRRVIDYVLYNKREA